jgi:replicative DNA helicase
MGKTGYAMTIALNAAKSGEAVGVFSLEMSESQLMARLIGGESGISSNRMMSGDVKEYEWQKLQAAIEGLENLKLYIDDTAAISLTALRAKARRMKMRYGISLLIVDYLQLMKDGDKSGNREQEISRISQGLKALAKELDIPVIALSQLSRAVETRGGSKRPQLSDLRESGSIEQDADIVCFIYRPEYYGITEDENGRSLAGIAEIDFAKHRNGGTGVEEVRFEAQFAKFSNLIDTQFPGTTPVQNAVPDWSPSAGITANRNELIDPPF